MVFAAQKMQAPKTIPTIPSRTEENVIPPAKLRIREITDRIREIIAIPDNFSGIDTQGCKK